MKYLILMCDFRQGVLLTWCLVSYVTDLQTKSCIVVVLHPVHSEAYVITKFELVSKRTRIILRTFMKDSPPLQSDCLCLLQGSTRYNFSVISGGLYIVDNKFLVSIVPMLDRPTTKLVSGWERPLMLLSLPLGMLRARTQTCILPCLATQQPMILPITISVNINILKVYTSLLKKGIII